MSEVNYINERFSGLSESATLAVKAKALELKKRGVDVIDLSAGEPDIDTPEHIKEGAILALKNGKTKYTAVAGIPELRQALADHYTVRHGNSYKSANVVVTNGGKQAIYQLLAVTVEKDDEVIYSAPYWVSYPPMVSLCGGKSSIIRTSPESRYLMSGSDLKSKLNRKSRWVIITSPSNPTGMGYTSEELHALALELSNSIESGASPNLLIMADDVYEEVTFKGFVAEPFAKIALSYPALKDRVITVGAFSKSFSMTGWRVGYSIAPLVISEACANYQSQTTSNVCSIAQWGALAAINGPKDFLKDSIKNFEARTDLSMQIIRETPGLSLEHRPIGAFYLFVDFSEAVKAGKVSNSIELAKYLLEEAHVAVVPGAPFGDDAAFRLSTSCDSEVLRNGLSRIQEAMKKLMSKM
jgi:aspartate aminotransferase